MSDETEQPAAPASARHILKLGKGKLNGTGKVLRADGSMKTDEMIAEDEADAPKVIHQVKE